MTVNLAKVLPALFWIVVLGVVLVLATQSPEEPTSYDDSSAGYESYDASTSCLDGAPAVAAYLDGVALELARPGLHADPDVQSSRLSPGDAAEIGRAAVDAEDSGAEIRVAVLPAGKLQDPDASQYSGDLVCEGESLVGELYDRVGTDGIYAVLVDADSSYQGRGLWAYEYDAEEEWHQVPKALDQAIACCAPRYAPMLEEFVEVAQREEPNWAARIGIGLGGLGAAVATVFGWRRFRRWRTREEAEQEIVEALRGPLDEEVVELSSAVSGLPPYAGDPDEQLARRQLRVLDLVEQARQRLDVLEEPSGAEAITERLADARYELVAITALREGRPVPERTDPCFFDPRHGPSSGAHDYAPEGGTARAVPVCAACAAQLAAGQKPEFRMLSYRGRVRFYWDSDAASGPYVNGYWRNRRHPEPRAETNRRPARPPLSRGSEKPAFTFVWEPSTSGSGGGGSGRSRSAYRSSSRSFGGGRSSRSSSRGGGRRF